MADVRLRWDGANVERMVERAIENGLTKLADQIANHAKSAMAEPKSGIHHKGAITRSSAPYEAPAAQTGRLQDSVHVEQDGKFSRKIGSRVEYALELELGTHKIAARPYLRPALYAFTGRTGEELFEQLL